MFNFYRSRSNPIGLEDSDEEDIEVPRFTSLDHENLDLEYDIHISCVNDKGIQILNSK